MDNISFAAVNVYAVNREGISALHDAVQYNHEEIAQLLINKGGQKLLNMKTSSGLLPYDLATTPDMKQLLQNPPTNNNNIKNNSNNNNNNNNSNNNKNTNNNASIEVHGEKKHSLDMDKYQNIEQLCTSDVEEYLLLLMALIRSYSACASRKKGGGGIELVADVEASSQLFTQHLGLIGGTLSPTAKLCVVAVKQMVRQHCTKSY